MSSRYTADGKRRSSMTHAERSHHCPCGRTLWGNGGWASHKRACPVYKGEVPRPPQPPVYDERYPVCLDCGRKIDPKTEMYFRDSMARMMRCYPCHEVVLGIRPPN
jgi:hypothetical protein